jgi:hypothetical protein
LQVCGAGDHGQGRDNKKETKERAFLTQYVSIIGEIPDEHFEDTTVPPAMLLAYRGARKTILDGDTLWGRYKGELNYELRKSGLKFPGVGNLSQLPSGTT